MRIVLAFLVAAAFLAGGCGSAPSGRTEVVAGFYPLAWAVEEIGGESVDVRNLTAAGAEPHDVELTPREVAAVQRADLVVYLSHGFQPAVEDAVDGATGELVDALGEIDLRDRAGDAEADPHVWLDPVRFAAVARRIGAALERPRAGEALAERLLALDREYRRGLARCESRTIVTSHAAFGYLADRYGLRQLPIAGVDAASEPSPSRLADLVRLVRREAVRTIFFERLVSPRVAETLARETGATTAVLDPIEGLAPADAERGDDYLTLMRRNLETLRSVLRCR